MSPTPNDIKDLPDVDLTPMMGDIEKAISQKEPQQQEPQQTQQVQHQQRNEFGQFKSPEEVLKGYKEVQSFATKVSQENKTLKEQMQQLQEQIELARLSSQQTYYPSQQQQIQQEPSLEQNIERIVATREIANVLEEEADRNRAEFQERYAYAQMVSREYPQLATSRKGVKKLFELGDKLMGDYRKKNASKALESILGSPLGEEEINKLRTLVKGDKAIPLNQQFNSNAYMPETSTSTKSGSDRNQMPNYESQMEEKSKKGDVDGVIDALFRKHLAE